MNKLLSEKPPCDPTHLSPLRPEFGLICQFSRFPFAFPDNRVPIHHRPCNSLIQCLSFEVADVPEYANLCP